MHWRAFVLRPLADLNADIALPGFGLVSELLSEISEAGQHRLN
jgi:7,8-dihydro-6-hydroxymethylpterin-pyrophosphokinase